MTYTGAVTDAEAQARGWRRLEKSKSGPTSIAISQGLLTTALTAHTADSAKPAIDPNLRGMDRVRADLKRQLSIK